MFASVLVCLLGLCKKYSTNFHKIRCKCGTWAMIETLDCGDKLEHVAVELVTIRWDTAILSMAGYVLPGICLKVSFSTPGTLVAVYSLLSAILVLCATGITNYAFTFFWMLVCWWWWFDWSFARLIAPVVQLSPPSPSSFASINTG